MCGIFGFQGNFDPNLLRFAIGVLGHRGPDESGYWYDRENRLGLAHTRLSIIDLSPTGQQPMWDVKNRFIIIYNGEIYNYHQLRNELIELGCEFLGTSDTEVILNLYGIEGPGMLNRLNGIFAFALWDVDRNSLLVARDGMGVKPLYYVQNETGIIWSSELKALLLEKTISRELDIPAIYNYLSLLWCPAPQTPLKAVKKLEPGCAMIIKEGRITNKWTFYRLPYDQPPSTIKIDQAIPLVRDTIKRAVERQMVADVPIGSFLSGGLDSTSVVCFANNICKKNGLQCFTIGFREEDHDKDGFTDDLPYAQLAAKELGVDLHVVEVGPEMSNQLEAMIYFLDEPQADPAPINTLYISQLARQHGIKVLLSGTGGDDIFSGYRRHLALKLEKLWSWLPSSARNALANGSNMLPSTPPIFRRIGKALRYANVDGDKRIASYFTWLEDKRVDQVINPELIESLVKRRSLGQLLDSLATIPNDTPTLNKMLFLESKHFLADHNLNYTDKMGMANGVEIRVPLLDPEVVELAAQLPLQMKLNGRECKWIFKKAMEPLLPKQIIYRPKSGFGAPLRFWMKKPLKPLIDDVLSEESIKRRGLFSHSGVQHLIRDNDQGRVDATYSIFSLVCVELWCRIFLDQASPLTNRPNWPND